MPQYEKAIGTEDGVTARYDEILEMFQRLNVRNARIFLMIGSGGTSGIEYSDDGTPIGFRLNEASAVEDLVKLVRAAKETDTKLTLVLHNYDLAVEHKDVLDDPVKRAAMIELDRRLLSKAFEALGEDSSYIAAIEPMNEPDNAPAVTHNTQEFVRAEIAMIRETTGKPISLGVDDIDKGKNWIQMLEEGDIFQIHWYHDSDEIPYGLPLFSELSRSIGNYYIPEGVRVVIGEAQPNMGEEQSIIAGAVDAGRASGAEGIWFWFDNREDAQYVFDEVDFAEVTDLIVTEVEIDGMIYTYYTSGRMATKTLSDGTVHEYSDEDWNGRTHGKLLKETRSDGTYKIFENYYEGTDQAKYIIEYTAEGTVIATYVYDDAGNLLRKTKADGTICTYYVSEGKDHGKLLKETRPDGTYKIFEDYYDGTDQAKYITEYTAEGAVIATYMYDAEGRLISKDGEPVEDETGEPVEDETAEPAEEGAGGPPPGDEETEEPVGEETADQGDPGSGCYIATSVGEQQTREEIAAIMEAQRKIAFVLKTWGETAINGISYLSTSFIPGMLARSYHMLLNGLKRGWSYLYVGTRSVTAAELPEEDLVSDSWVAQDYFDSRGIMDVTLEGETLLLHADMEGQHPEKSKGEAYLSFPSPVDIAGRKMTIKMRVTEALAASQINYVQLFAKDENWYSQYARATVIKRSGEWLTIEYTPTTYDVDMQKGDDTDFDPTRITWLGIKIAISGAVDDTFSGVIEVKEVFVDGTVQTIEPAERVEIYSDSPVEVNPTTPEEFSANSGASFYLSQREEAIGTGNGVTAREAEIREMFQRVNVRKGRVFLTIGSGGTSGIEYSDDGTPIGFVLDEASAVEDLVTLVRIAKETDTKLTLVLHDYDLAVEHKDVLDDPVKRAAMIELDRRILAGAFEELGEDSSYIEAIEPMNEPDNANTFASNTQKFVREIIAMIRETTGKPVSVGSGNIEASVYWIQMLEAGDIFQIHWYHDFDERPYSLPLFTALERNIGDYEIPEGVRVVIGEAQSIMGGQSIIAGAVDAGRASGAEGI